MSEKPLLPKKKRKSEKLHLNIRKKWEGIVRNVDKREVPVDVLDTIRISLIDGTSITIDVKQLLADGSDPVEIEEMLNDRFDELDEYIKTVDFHVDIEQVVSAIQPETDKVLKNL